MEAGPSGNVLVSPLREGSYPGPSGKVILFLRESGGCLETHK